MSRQAIEQLVGRAIVDCAYRTRLLANPASALDDFELSDIERQRIGRIRAFDLGDFARRLERILEHPARPLSASAGPARQPRRIGRAAV